MLTPGSGSDIRAAGSPRLIWSVVTLWAAVLLLASLFLAWSHQLPQRFVAEVGPGPALYGVLANPDGWQVFGIVDVLLAVVAAAIAGFGLATFLGHSIGRGGRTAVAGAAIIALIFVVHALAVPPTNGILDAHSVGSSYRYVSDPATDGPGETVALLALLLALLGLVGSIASQWLDAGRD